MSLLSTLFYYTSWSEFSQKVFIKQLGLSQVLRASSNTWKWRIFFIFWKSLNWKKIYLQSLLLVVECTKLFGTSCSYLVRKYILWYNIFVQILRSTFLRLSEDFHSELDRLRWCILTIWLFPKIFRPDLKSRKYSAVLWQIQELKVDM